MDKLNNAFTLFFSLLVEAMPFLLIGVLFSGLLLLFVDERKLIDSLPRNPLLGAIVGSCVGFLFPVCECGNVPVSRRLLLQGAPVSVAMGFLLAAPTINPIVIWSTWVAFRDQPEIVVLRVVFSLGIAIVMGCVFSVQKDLRPLLQPAITRSMLRSVHSVGKGVKDTTIQDERKPVLLQSGSFLLSQQGAPLRMDASVMQASLAAAKPSKPLSIRLRLFLENTVQELRELGSVLILGSAIAAIIQVAVPREVILSLGQGPVTSILAMMLLAGVVSICSTVDSFFALAFASTFTGGSLLAFLVFGPMIDIKAIGLMLSVFKARALVYLFAIIAQLIFLLTLFVNLHIS
ncbi:MULTISPECIES: permease [unclassified Coleofasciculus]|uniref:permease n=1 Tax=unclassified Coleofasciculus TaxID=2692782 RepID=UPI0018822C00|nr:MULTISPECIES: permease [unclassified Coleofasciculus]MBE9126448.1 permease [Coleofasciculus sp. LEGE 07081]MBE9148050.1 permease [Coleofasciculus sp. LEGE 07092]